MANFIANSHKIRSNRMISDLFKHKQHDYKFAHSMFVHFKKLKARESLSTSGKKKTKKKNKSIRSFSHSHLLNIWDKSLLTLALPNLIL